MHKIKTLKYNDWLSLKKVIWPEKGIKGYVYSHEERCNGEIIAILPYRRIYPEDEYQFLLREEFTPAWSTSVPFISSITGGVEKKGVYETLMEELYEETGYYLQTMKVALSRITSLGTSFGVKSSDTVYHLFAIDLTGLERGEASGDGSELEAQAHCFWTNKHKVVTADDPFVHILYVRLMNKKGNI